MNTFNRNVSKITAATFLALTLTACGGGGGGSNHSPTTESTPTVQPSNNGNKVEQSANQNDNSHTTTTNTNNTVNSNTIANSGNSGSVSNNTTAPEAVNNEKFLAEAKANKTYAVLNLRNDVHKDLLSEYGQDGYRKLDSYSVNLNGKSYSSGNIDLSTLGQGVKRIGFTETATATVDGAKATAIRNNTLHIYQQPYSIVAGVEVKGGEVSAPRFREVLDADDVDFNTVKGYATQTLPASGKFNYVGDALSQEQTGRLNYTVDFAAKTGSGSISNIAGGITLDKGSIVTMTHTNPDKTSISGYGISSNAHSNSDLSGIYKLGFFGPNADEIAGVVEYNEQGVVGFGGKKQ